MMIFQLSCEGLIAEFRCLPGDKLVPGVINSREVSYILDDWGSARDAGVPGAWYGEIESSMRLFFDREVTTIDVSDASDDDEGICME